MPIGELILIAISEKNIYLSNKPQITFFKSVYKKYSNFAIETIPQYFKIKPNFGKKVTVQISKNADLLSKIRLAIELPSLPLSNHSTLPDNTKKIKWVEKIGLAIIDYVDLEIGGIVLAREYGEWLNIWYELTNNLETNDIFNKMIGNVDELKDYTNGKEKYYLNIPLNFWFCRDYGQALPIISLTNQNIKIHVKFNQFQNCIKESPTHYFETDNVICLYKENEIITQTINGQMYKGIFVYFDLNNKRVYYNKLVGDFQISDNNNNNYYIIGKETKFKMIPKNNTLITKDESYFYLGDPIIETSNLLVDYIFLDNIEKKKFLENKKIEYLITEERFVVTQTIYNNDFSYKIPLVNPVKNIYWRTVLLNNYYLNDRFNYTTYPITEKEENILEKHNIIINSIKVIENDTWENYYYLQKYISNYSSSQKGIYNYSFSLKPLEYQPSGSLNFSQINDAYLKLSINPSINYNNPANIVLFSTQYNIFCVTNGLGGMKYYL
jgi:hypothetical protein